MLRDVFYYGSKPNVHPREKPAKDFEEARYLATTEHFWIVNEFCDYINFDWDFDFELLDDDDQWHQEHINIWPSQHQKDSGTWLCNKKSSDTVIYRTDVDPIIRKNIKSDNWILLEDINEKIFDFSWHPDPTSPPYIYKFGCRFYPVTTQAVLEYHVPGATEYCYMDIVVELQEKYENWKILEDIDKNTFDFTWRPNPTSPPYIYVWGNQHYPGTIMPTVEYHVPGATDKKYIDQTWHAKLISKPQNFKILEKFTDFDFSWVPDPTSPPYIYVWGNQWNNAVSKASVIYETPGAEEYKYMNARVKRLPDKINWIIPNNIDQNSFDFSWEPDPNNPPYIYQFGTQHQKTGGPKFVVAGATEVKFIGNLKAKALPTTENWKILNNLTVDFDFSWHPDETEEPYIHIFGNQYYKAEVMPTVEYHTPGATQTKYNNLKHAIVKTDQNNWYIPYNVDISEFDLNWFPNINDEPYIYEWNTQWQKNGGPKYIVSGSTETKYMFSTKSKTLPIKEHWEILENIDEEGFDFSWHPDNTEELYIYIFGNQYYSAEVMPTIRYKTPGATQVKYINDVKAKLRKCRDNWVIPDNIDVSDFDFSWVPNPNDMPFIYQFGTQWQKTGGPKYVVDGATEIKYIDTTMAKALPNPQLANWELPNKIDIDTANFDFSWHPDETEPPFIYQFGTQHQKTGGPRYIVSGATEIKYITENHATSLTNKNDPCWKVLLEIEDFDFSWHPDENEPPYIYVFGNKWNKADKQQTVLYTVPGASEYKYQYDITAKLPAYETNFEILFPIESFDFSWIPDPYDPPYIYVFGNNWYGAEDMPTIRYTVKNATEIKYVNDVKAKLKSDYSNWKQLIPIDKNKFDFSWVPHPEDPPYIYIFGNTQFSPEKMPTLQYTVPGATQLKYMQEPKAILKTDKKNWKVLLDVDLVDFDYSWIPDPEDPPYIYVFGNQWYEAEIEPTIQYHVDGATDYKYINEIKATVLPNMTNWFIPDKVNVEDFDFSWHPDPGSPPYIYQFGTLKDDNDGPMYIHPKNTGEVVYRLRVKKSDQNSVFEVPKYFIETTLDDLVEQHPNEVFWACNKNINYSNFDFNWRPSIEQVRYVHVFGSPESKETQTYFVSGKLYKQGFRNFNFINQDLKLEDEYLADIFVTPDMFFIDRANKESQQRFEQLKERFPNIQKARYVGSWVDTIYRCLNKCSTHLAWILSSEYDYSNFDFRYYPNPWQLDMVHIFGTQWNQWGNTYIVNKDKFYESTKYVKTIEHLKNINFVRSKVTKITSCLHDVYLINYGTSHTKDVKSQIEKKTGKEVVVVNYNKDYLTTFKDLLSLLPDKKEHYIWVCSSICNYELFDFSFTPDFYSKENLHVFASNRQKLGDTFLIDVNRLRLLINDLVLLQSYSKISYINYIKVSRLKAPVFEVDSDTHEMSYHTDFDFPYAIFNTYDNKNLKFDYQEPMSLWDNTTKNIEILSTGASSVVIPKEVQNYKEGELYNYPYIITSKTLQKSKPLDIVFLSNGEKYADQNYDHLLKITKKLPNRVIRVDGISGRVKAYHAAAKESDTPWLFTVFAKLTIDENFDFSWQPDRLQKPKHYIFHAKNPVNGLIYGHQAMIAYNKKLTLKNNGKGLDFTLDDPHSVVNVLSGVANFNTDPCSTWRTAFREVIKLKSDYEDISRERLEVWLTKAEGDYAESCLQGAKDAVDYYDEVSGDIEKLKLTYEWEWLHDYYATKYK